MCRNVKSVSICPTCNKHMSESTNKQWCRDARRKGHFGRCSMGVRKAEDEFRGAECEGCAKIREKAMNELDMNDFAEKRLGWRTSKGKGDGQGGGDCMLDNSDDEYGYSW
ncbi:hypothetical protein F5X99DRAFT_412568 [Biscogniauxia marginata]|nr:hypothetical protein F5X99DRAFT_412568 [Biscogniauxia marginata]